VIKALSLYRLIGGTLLIINGVEWIMQGSHAILAALSICLGGVMVWNCVETLGFLDDDDDDDDDFMHTQKA
jgi:hypothetical protein